MLLPDFGPGFAGRAADKDPGVVVELFVVDALGVPVVPGEAAVGKKLIGLLRPNSENNQRGWRRRGIAAQPLGICGADGLGETIRASQNVDGTVLAEMLDTVYLPLISAISR